MRALHGADVYAFALVLLELCTQEVPFKGIDPMLVMEYVKR